MCLIRSNTANSVSPDMIQFDALDFSECRYEERSVYIMIPLSRVLCFHMKLVTHWLNMVSSQWNLVLIRILFMTLNLKH